MSISRVFLDIEDVVEVELERKDGKLVIWMHRTLLTHGGKDRLFDFGYRAAVLGCNRHPAYIIPAIKRL